MIVKTLLSETELIDLCRQRDPRAQRQLYERYAGKMMGVCRRYIRGADDLQDVFAEGFLKVFRYIDQYDGRGALGAWLRRVFVHECLRFLRRRKPLCTQLDDEFVTRTAVSPATAETDIATAELWELYENLPTGYRAVFNLYAIEGFTHPQIAAALGISEGTSKSQLFKARQLLQRQIEELHAVSECA